MTRRGGPQQVPRPSAWSPGRPAPWTGLDPAARRLRADAVHRAVPPGRTGIPSPVEQDGASQSAVLVPLYVEDDEMHVVLTRRAWSLRTHRGEVSFPGGRAEPGESALATALRESSEEIDLDPDSVEPLGELDHLTTVTRRAYIVPVVGLLPSRPDLRLNEGEVDEALHVPTSELLEPGVFREELWGTPDTARPVYFFELVGDTIWGATAAILRQLLARLTDTDPGTDVDMDPARDLGPMPPWLTPEQERGVV